MIVAIFLTDIWCKITFRITFAWHVTAKLIQPNWTSLMSCDRQSLFNQLNSIGFNVELPFALIQLAGSNLTSGNSLSRVTITQYPKCNRDSIKCLWVPPPYPVFRIWNTGKSICLKMLTGVLSLLPLNPLTPALFFLSRRFSLSTTNKTPEQAIYRPNSVAI